MLEEVPATSRPAILREERSMITGPRSGPDGRGASHFSLTTFPCGRGEHVGGMAEMPGNRREPPGKV